MQTSLNSFFRPSVSSLSFARRLVAGVLLINTLVIGLASLGIYQDRLEHDRRSRTTVENLSMLLESDLTAVFDRTELLLRTVVAEIEDQLARGGIQPTRLSAYLKLQQSHLPEIVSLRVTDDNGLVRYGEGVQPGTPVDLSDREFFILPRGNPKAGLVIAKPVKARISNEWVIPVSYRINRQNGDFAGVVYANIPVTYFVRKFSVLQLGSHGLVALRSTEHYSIARFPEVQEGGGAVGQFAISDQLRSLLKDDPSSVTYVAPSPQDRIERTFSYRRMAGYPLYVVVGLATQDTQEEWWRDSYQTAALVMLILLMSLLFAWLVVSAWRRQQAASQALRESEQRWSFALESGNFAVWDLDLRSGEVQFSKLGKKLFGFGEDEIGNHIAEWVARCHPDDQEAVWSRLKDHFRGRTESFLAEHRVRCHDDRWKWIRSEGLVVDRAEDGKPLRMIGIHADISERKQREEELRLSSTVFKLADEAMIITNQSNEIVSVNPAFTAITGYAPEEAIGRNPRMLSAHKQTTEFYQEMWRRLTESDAWSGEVLNRKKNGEIYIEWLSIKRVLDDNGKLTHHVAVFSDITMRKSAENRMRYLALHDALTDLPNRALLTERLEQAIVAARRDKSGLGLMYFDLDNFKPINDSFGHEMGDLLLKAVADRVLDCVRESDTVARLGGDEFAVLLPKLETAKDAMMVAEKIRNALGEHFLLAGDSFEISASIGVAIYPEHGDDERTLLRSADTAMYHAKRGGRNQVVLYQAGMQ